MRFRRTSLPAAAFISRVDRRSAAAAGVAPARRVVARSFHPRPSNEEPFRVVRAVPLHQLGARRSLARSVVGYVRTLRGPTTQVPLTSSDPFDMNVRHCGALSVA